ncbi:hypothetical protein BC628DRAFT_666069 [Trametes gibbosa]|nr:hypothetical protein BC628DRAFT_666069 [Trametes gibbosa]
MRASCPRLLDSIHSLATQPNEGHLRGCPTNCREASSPPLYPRRSRTTPSPCHLRFPRRMSLSRRRRIRNPNSGNAWASTNAKATDSLPRLMQPFLSPDVEAGIHLEALCHAARVRTCTGRVQEMLTSREHLLNFPMIPPASGRLKKYEPVRELTNIPCYNFLIRRCCAPACPGMETVFHCN